MSRVASCPTCASPIPVDAWPSWCEECDWGIVAPPRQPPSTRLEDARLDTTHPPTASRIAVLEMRPRREAVVTLDRGASAAIDDELSRYREEVSKRLIDDHRARLFY